MKLKAPQGVGDPCVAGVIIAPCDGLYEVEPEVGALLIECFGFVEAGSRHGKAECREAAGAAAGRRPAKSRKRRIRPWPHPISPRLPM